MMNRLLAYGLVAGVLAGVLSLGFAEAFGEPQVNRAIAVEEAASAAAGEPAEDEVVSRAVQGSVGLGVAVLVYGAAIGGLFTVVFAFAYGRIGRLAARPLAALLALGGFVTVIGVPFLKYPPAPPGVGDPATIDRRTGLYFALLAASIVLAVLTVQVARRLTPRLGAWNAVLVAAATFIAATTAIGYALPDVHEIPADYPAGVLYQFRLASIGTQAVLWTALGLIFGVLARRAVGVATAARPAEVSAP